MSETSGGRSEGVAVFGASSAMAQGAARRFAAGGARFYLVGRDAAKLAVLAADLKARGAAEVTTEALDLAQVEALAALVERVVTRLQGVDVALLAHGVLGDQAAEEASYAAAEAALRVNFLSFVAILTPLAQAMETARRGTIAVISSVAGDRGRQSNYVYGTAKGALTVFAQGLRNRLQKSGVHVLTVKPGFVSSPMTAHLKQGPLFVPADVVGEGIFRAIRARRDVAYLPGFWLVIMLVIKMVPEAVFKRLKL